MNILNKIAIIFLIALSFSRAMATYWEPEDCDKKLGYYLYLPSFVHIDNEGKFKIDEKNEKTDKQITLSEDAKQLNVLNSNGTIARSIKIETKNDRIILKESDSTHPKVRSDSFSRLLELVKTNNTCIVDLKISKVSGLFYVDMSIDYDSKTCDLIKDAVTELGINGFFNKCVETLDSAIKKISERSNQIAKEKGYKYASHNTWGEHTPPLPTSDELAIFGECTDRELYYKQLQSNSESDSKNKK